MLKWNLSLLCLEIVLILMQDRCTNCIERTICFEYIWKHPIELQDDVCHIESHFGLFGDSVSFGARYVHGLCLMHHMLRNYFGSTRWYSLVKRLIWNLGSICLEIVLILMQDGCTVCMEHTICSEINLDTPDGTVDASDGTSR